MSKQILALIDSFGATSYGGAGKVFIEVNKALVKEGHRVGAICRSADDLPEDLYDGITFHTYRDIPGGQLSKVKHYRNKIKRLFLQEIEENKPDFILLHSSSAAMGLKNILKTSGIPVIYYFHSPWNKEYEILARDQEMTFCGGQCPLVSILAAIRKRHEKKYLNLASGIVTLSESMKQVMLEVHKGVGEIPREIIPGGANRKIFYPALNQKEKKYIRGKLKLPKEDLLIISSRRLVPRTGLDVLIEAFAEIQKNQYAPSKEVKLILTGSGVSEEPLKQQTKDLGLADKVIFTGYVMEKRLAEYYRCSDLFVMPTKELEGFGLSTVEAMASGLPVIGTDVGGTPEILSKVSDDLIIPECNPKAIAGKIEEFLAKPVTAIQTLGEKSHKCVEDNFTWEKHVEQLLEFVAKGDV